MPAWSDGTPEGERASWALVHFIRRLSQLTPADLERMETLNPKSPAHWKEDLPDIPLHSIVVDPTIGSGLRRHRSRCDGLDRRRPDVDD